MNQIEKHEKAIRILELINECDRMLNSHKKTLSLLRLRDFKTMKSHYEQRIEITEKIKERLTNYYNNQIKKL